MKGIFDVNLRRKFKMQWKTVKHGYTRIVKKFLWFPVNINGKRL
jgi:hypothetical protein